MKTILVTGFEPFGGEKVNPSFLCADSLPDSIPGARIEKRMLPVSWQRTPAELRRLLGELCPDAVLLMGQAGGRAGISIERVAVNLRETGMKDNDGVEINDGSPVVPGGPAAYFSSLPVSSMLSVCREAFVPASFSFSAGCYLCNCAMYTALSWAAENGNRPAGFIHVPYLPSQVYDKPSMSLELLRQGILLCTQAIADSIK